MSIVCNFSGTSELFLSFSKISCTSFYGSLDGSATSVDLGLVSSCGFYSGLGTMKLGGLALIINLAGLESALDFFGPPTLMILNLSLLDYLL